jgi:hypothetical protein
LLGERRWITTGHASPRCRRRRACRTGAAEPPAAFGARELALCGTLDDLLALRCDIVVEAAGDSGAGAAHAAAAISAGRGMAMVTTGVECVFGPALHARARAAGLPCTLVDGARLAPLLGLVAWARLLGLPIGAAGKSSEHDHVFEPGSGRVAWLEHMVDAPELHGLWPLGEDRAVAIASLPQRMAPGGLLTGRRPPRPNEQTNRIGRRTP